MRLVYTGTTCGWRSVAGRAVTKCCRRPPSPARSIPWPSLQVAADASGARRRWCRGGGGGGCAWGGNGCAVDARKVTHGVGNVQRRRRSRPFVPKCGVVRGTEPAAGHDTASVRARLRGTVEHDSCGVGHARSYGVQHVVAAITNSRNGGTPVQFFCVYMYGYVACDISVSLVGVQRSTDVLQNPARQNCILAGRHGSASVFIREDGP